MNSMLNVHNPRQCYMTKNWSRDLSLYQLGFGGRGIGFRDSSQDVMGVMSAMPEEACELIEKLLTFDAVVVAGQAKSHCLAWTIDDLLDDEEVQERLAERTYLLEDCTSPVVVPGVVDYTVEADAAFERYAAAGMHVVRSTESITSWPGLATRIGR